MALDSGGNTRIDFVWGNHPVDPAGTREDAFYPASWGGYPDAPPATVTVPDLRGKTSTAAGTTLTGLNLSSTTAFGTFKEPVWGQYPVPGAKVAPGTKVHLTGTPSTTDTSQKIAVPNVVGNARAAAQATLTALGFTTSGTPTTVASTTPVAGTLLDFGSNIVLA